MKKQSIVEADEILVIKIEPGEGGIPVEMFSDILIAHQDVLRLVAKAENKDISEPNLRIVDVQHGSMEIKAVIQTLQLCLPFVKPYLGKLGSSIKDALTGTSTIEGKRSVRIPNKVLDKMSIPMLEGIVKSVAMFEEGKEDTPFYNISAKEVKEIFEEEPEQPATLLPNELGEIQVFTGHLKEIDWDNDKGKFLTQIDGKPRKVQCTILDQKFLALKVGGNEHVKLTAIPEYRVNALGEKTLHSFQVQTVEILDY